MDNHRRSASDSFVLYSVMKFNSYVLASSQVPFLFSCIFLSFLFALFFVTPSSCLFALVSLTFPVLGPLIFRVLASSIVLSGFLHLFLNPELATPTACLGYSFYFSRACLLTIIVPASWMI
jgi:hypothetical protein